ncbi:MAG: hypothetical protein KF688_02980 [Pirellulales bacterium]|nr:hypothetical protein [Pirellulales bacterium]
MLEMTGDNIAVLDDADLRSLVGLLCEAELLEHGLPSAAVTWGGNQNAIDGGIDVRVKSEEGQPPGGFIPRNYIGFQVKKSDFTPASIGPEMRPKGGLRKSIEGLIELAGAYIIASSGTNASDSALTDRIDAMRAAVADHPDHGDLHLDFYDRNRLATWTRRHPGIVLWVRQHIGYSIPGWQPYGSWAVSPDGVDDEYLLDDKARLHAGMTDEKGVDVTQGINQLRGILATPRSVVRLAGLSGVGKTRLVQALFDARVGSNPLASARAVYADMNDNPSPQPTAMVSDLVASRIRAVVVIDNCAPDLHRRITEISRGPESLLSVITIEYDVQDDEPEGTDVFCFKPSSGELVERLLARRYPAMTEPDVKRIAEFSGGNARVALAIANTLERHESVAGLQDEELFRRLFHQRQTPDKSLLQAAQACALLYSFQGEALSGEEAELPKIAALAGMDAQQLFANISVLRQRDLVQRRSVWRAILPHAVAGRLARMALRETPLVKIETAFNTERLMKSFSRRLGYLHDSEDAVRIAQRWLANGGFLDCVGHLSKLGLAMFENIAPVSPESTLIAIERAWSGPRAVELLTAQEQRERIGYILQSIAYDESLFDRCVAVLIPLALAEKSDDRSHPLRDAIKSLFHVVLSGTHATIEQRTQIVEGLLGSKLPERRGLGLQLLEALLRCDRIPRSQRYEFGARARDYGYAPTTPDEHEHWFTTTLQMTRRFVSIGGHDVSVIRAMVADSIWDLWFLGGMLQAQFEAFAVEVATNSYWEDGWIVVRYKLSRLSDKEKEDISGVARLKEFERRLRPLNVREQVRAVVLAGRRLMIDYDESVDEIDDANRLKDLHERAYVVAEKLGKTVGGDLALLTELLPDLVSGSGKRLFPFGRGLALGCDDIRRVWGQLTAAVANTEENQRNLCALDGFLNGLATIDLPLCEALLDEALTDQTFGVWFPRLQSSIAITPAGVDRLIRAAKLGIAQPDSFRFLSWERTAESVSAGDLRVIIETLAKQKLGYAVAIDMLADRFHPGADKYKEHPSELIDLGRALLSSPDVSALDKTRDYYLQSIANVCLRGPDGSTAAQGLCERINQELSNRSIQDYDFEQLLHSVFELQPRIALGAFLGSESSADSRGSVRVVFDWLQRGARRSPLDRVPSDELFRWCDHDPAVRYPIVAMLISFDKSRPEGGVEWTTVAMEMLERAPDQLAVLEAFIGQFRSNSWSGSLAAILESRLGLLDSLDQLINPAIEKLVADTRPKLEEEIRQWREWEDARVSERDERFE